MKPLALLWASMALANPLRLDLHLHLDLPGRLKNTLHDLLPEPGLTADDLPVVELPYEKHRASPPLTKNQSYYVFANIPYAKQPVGDLRFKEAQPLESVGGSLPLNDGQNGVVCPQSQVGWYNYAESFVKDYYGSSDANLDKWKYPIAAGKNYSWSEKIPSIPRMSESCLTLDVYVPKRIYDERNDNYGWDAAVMVWFSGGGFVFGSKDLFGSPAGLFNASLQKEDENFQEMIFVAVNYRLGAFGWLAGSNFTEGGGFENAGLSDQVVAYQWIQDNIKLFGGNPSEVTAAGQSAGASSILLHLTSYGGGKFGRKDQPKFRKAILQSPALFPIIQASQMNRTYRSFLEAAEAKDFADLVKKDTNTLIRANSKTIYDSPYGQFNYGPVPNGQYVPIPPHLALRYGLFWPKEIVVSYNNAEGLLFTPPWVRTKEDMEKYILDAYPKFEKEELKRLLDELYVYGKGLSPKQALNLTAQLLGDFAVTSNVRGLTSALPTYEYLFDLFPGIHGQDTSYTSYPTQDKTVNEVQAQRLQRYLTSFVKWSTPNEAVVESDKEWAPYSYEDKRMTFGSGKIPPTTDSYYDMQPDNIDKARSEFWLTAPYWGEDEDISAYKMGHSEKDRSALRVQGGVEHTMPDLEL